jgi:PleD family two-component response regulator
MSIEELIDYSDAALYQSKNTGRNKVTVFSSKSDIK